MEFFAQELFEQLLTEPINILPKDGEVNYYGEIIPLNESDFYFNALLNEIDFSFIVGVL